MSVMLSSICKDHFDKIYLNELLLLKPISPDMPKKIIESGSHVQTVMTIYFPGIKRTATRDETLNWNFELYQVGMLDQLNLEVNETLFEPDSFYNDLINLEENQHRKIEGMSPKKKDKSLLERKVSLYWGNYLGSPKEPKHVDVFRLKEFASVDYDKIKKKEVGVVLEKHNKENYSKIIVFGKEIYDFIFRFSYINPVAKKPKTSDDPYFHFEELVKEETKSNSGTPRKFYSFEEYLLKSPSDIKTQIRESLKEDERKTLDDNLIEYNFHQDLTVAPRPHGFLYSYFLSSKEFIQIYTTERLWKEENLPDKSTYVLNIMPHSKVHYDTYFQLPITAQLQCPSCLYLKNALQIQKITKGFGLMTDYVKTITPKDKEKEYQDFLKNLRDFAQ